MKFKQRLLTGVAIGIGFSIPYTTGNILWSSYSYPFITEMESGKKEILLTKNFGLKIKEVKRGPFDEDPVAIYGIVENDTGALLSGLDLEAEIYDEALNNIYLYPCKGSVNGYIKPYSERRFIIQCHGADLTQGKLSINVIATDVTVHSTGITRPSI